MSELAQAPQNQDYQTGAENEPFPMERKPNGAETERCGNRPREAARRGPSVFNYFVGSPYAHKFKLSATSPYQSISRPLFPIVLSYRILTRAFVNLPVIPSCIFYFLCYVSAVCETPQTYVNRNYIKISRTDKISDFMNDYELDKQIGKNGVCTMPNGTYKTLSPLVQLHIKRLWITGSCDSDESLIGSIKRIDPRVNSDVVLSFLKDHTTNEKWVSEREKFLQSQYDKYITDAEKLSGFLDEEYDKMFSKVRVLCEQQLEHYAIESSLGLVSPRTGNLKNITETLEKCYLAQRLARNMSQGNFENRVVKEESDAFYDALDKINDILGAKTINAKILKAV